MNIKVCGITDLEQLHQMDKLMVDYAGFVFDSSSYQCVAGKLNPKEVKYAKVDLKKVGVFVNAELNFVLDTVLDYGLDLVQLSGKESPDYCKSLSREITVIKTFYIDEFNSEKIHQVIPFRLIAPDPVRNPALCPKQNLILHSQKHPLFSSPL